MKVLTIGTFDLLHIGHLELFSYGKQLGELTVGLNTDKFVEQFKGKPIQDYDIRLANVKRYAGHIANAVENDSAGKELIDKVKPAMLLVGMDWHEEDYLNQIGVDAKYLNDNNIILAYAPRTTGVSTTALKKKL